jgi:hypothetical protein
MKRLLILTPLVLAFLGFTGCEWLRKLGDTGKKNTMDGPLEPKTREQLVGYLNRQSEAVNSVKFPSVSIDVKAQKEEFSMHSSSLLCSKPRNFSLVGGKAVIGEVMNVGSNNQEFWMYTKFPDPTYVFCSHQDFSRGAGQLPFPFDPEWAMQALGMSFYDPNAMYKVELDEPNREHRLSYETTTPQGSTVRRVIVFAADPMGDKKPQVRKHLILDNATSQPIAIAEVREIVTLNAGRDRTTLKDVFVQIPTEVTLEWPQQQFKMSLKLRGAKVNEPMSEAENRELFTKPKYSNVSPVNLANQPIFRGSTPDVRRKR